MCTDKYFFCRVLNETDRDLLGCDTPKFVINMLPLESFLIRTLARLYNTLCCHIPEDCNVDIVVRTSDLMFSVMTYNFAKTTNF